MCLLDNEYLKLAYYLDAEINLAMNMVKVMAVDRFDALAKRPCKYRKSDPYGGQFAGKRPSECASIEVEREGVK